MNYNIGFTFFFLLLGTAIADDTPRTCSKGGVTGTCIAITKCKQILDASAKTSAYYSLLRRRSCGYENKTPKICCTKEEQFLPANCGDDSTSRSVGGQRTDIDEHPWIVALEDNRNQDHILCGGAIINNRYILTAAHCVSYNLLPPGATPTTVRLGEWDTESSVDCDAKCSDDIVRISIEQIIIHENYDTSTVDRHHDIALLRLSSDITFTTYIKPICLPENADLSENFIVAGWGVTENRTQSRYKQKVKLPFFDKDLCASIFKKISRPREVDGSQICAGGEKGIDACNGDSGGPLMQQTIRSDGISRWSAVGITSYGFKQCGQKGNPGVYTNVYYHKSWILDQLRS